MKKIVRGPGWQRQDCYLGVEFTLAALAATFLYLFDLIRLLRLRNPLASPQIIDKFTMTVLFIVVAYGMLMAIMAFHQDWEKRNDKPKAQFFFLGILGNSMGWGLLFCFITLIKGVK